MSKKTLNETNLQALGAERLAALLMEVSTGSAEIKRRLRLELSHNLGADALAHDVRKRLASIRRTKGYVGWRKRKALVKDLNTQAAMITDKIAVDAPSEAFDLLWQFIELAPSVYARVDDSRGDVSEAFGAALQHFLQIGPRAGQEPEALAPRIWAALRDSSYGEFDGIITLLAPTLGDAGLDQLKALIEDHQHDEQDTEEDHAALQFLRDLRGSGGSFRADQKRRLICSSLQEIAVVQGDTDAYIAQYSVDDLARPRIAAEVAQLHLEQGRAQDGLDVLTGVDPASSGDAAWDAAYVACLLALGHTQDAQEHRWAVFSETLDAQTLRDYLKMLPDFEDIEVEDAAKAHAAQFYDVHAALAFLIEWPDLIGAAKLVEEHVQELGGGLSHILTPAAEALRTRHPRAAMLLWRAMINDTLWEARTARYAAAADHLMDCAAADSEIETYGGFATHDAYLQSLRETHKHKASFWKRVP
jgi:hypothetical protein